MKRGADQVELADPSSLHDMQARYLVSACPTGRKCVGQKHGQTGREATDMVYIHCARPETLVDGTQERITATGWVGGGKYLLSVPFSLFTSHITMSIVLKTITIRKDETIKMAKRANGEGTVYKRKDGRWVASVTLPDGKRKSFYFKTKAEAIAAKNQAAVANAQGALIASPDQTLGDFLRDWLHHAARQTLRERSFDRYNDMIELHILPLLGKVKLQKLTPQHLQRFYSQKSEQLAPATVRVIHAVLHRALSDALRWELVSRNVCDVVKAPRVPKKEMHALTFEQARHLLKTAQGDPLEALYVLALTTGMRQGELLGLKWEDVDMQHGKVTIKRALSRFRHQGLKVTEPKTEKSRRTIPLIPLALEALRQHRVRQQERRRAAGPRWKDQGWIFCNTQGGPLYADHVVEHSFRPLLERAGLPRIRFHDLRHSTASLLLALDVHPKFVQELLGHSTISMTLDTYSHVLPSMLEDALAGLNTMLQA